MIKFVYCYAIIKTNGRIYSLGNNTSFEKYKYLKILCLFYDQNDIAVISEDDITIEEHETAYCITDTFKHQITQVFKEEAGNMLENPVNQEDINNFNKLAIKRCIGCGYCCRKAVCDIGQYVYGIMPGEICPGLLWNEKEQRYRCSLVIENYPNIYKILSINEGCCSNMNTWRRKVKKRF
jgi:hypothetical protein